MHWLAAVLIGLAGSTGCTAAVARRTRARSIVVASTDVWGSVARAVAGRHVTVKSILSGRRHRSALLPGQPVRRGRHHRRRPGGLQRRRLRRMGRRGAGPPSGRPSRSTRTRFCRTRTTTPNEHVFYDLNVAKSVAAAIADRLAAIDPGNAADYRANAAAFGRDADAIAGSEHTVATTLPQHLGRRDRAGRVLPAEGVGPGRTAPRPALKRPTRTKPIPRRPTWRPSSTWSTSARSSRCWSTRRRPPPRSTACKMPPRRAGVPVTEVTETLPDRHRLPDLAAQHRQPAGGRAAVEPKSVPAVSTEAVRDRSTATAPTVSLTRRPAGVR